MISNIEKWYMRLVLTLASIFYSIHLITTYITFFFQPEGFINISNQLLNYLHNHVDGATFWTTYGVFFLIICLGSLALPRIFIWPAVIMNMFILVGSLELVWNNYERAIQFWAQSNTEYGQYTWVIDQVFFIFFSALFVALLMPSLINLGKHNSWLKRIFRRRK